MLVPMRLAIVPDDTGSTFAPGDEEIADTPAVPDEQTDEVDGDTEADPVAADTDTDRQEWLLVVEGVETGDGRTIEEGALTWRDLPLPLMATDVTSEGHDGARLVANIVEIEREGTEIYGWTVNVESDDPQVVALQKLIADGDLKGVSVDMDSVEGSMVVSEEEMTENVDGSVEIPMAAPKFRISSARIMGATAVPFPAFAEAQQIAASLVAGAMTVDRPTDEQEASFEESGYPIQPPVAPPADWFADPQLSGPVPLTVTDEGRVFGHVALWASCHRGFDSCTPPPRAPNGNYEHFHTGTVVASNGDRVGVGNITVDAGHADLTDGAYRAKEHYDHTGWIGADVRCGEDKHGIWMAGAIRPQISPEGIRALMAADVSGDWRAIDGKLRLIGLASVPVPGFVKTQVASGQLVAMVASVPVCDESDDAEMGAIADRIALSVGRHRDQLMAERDRIAFGLGRHPSQRRAALAVVVDGTR